MLLPVYDALGADQTVGNGQCCLCLVLLPACWPAVLFAACFWLAWPWVVLIKCMRSSEPFRIIVGIIVGIT